MADTKSAPEINNEIKEVEQVEKIKQGTPIEGTDKKKKQLSEIQIQHLNAIRVKALERKREIKLQKHKQYEEECKLKRINNIKQVQLTQPIQPAEPAEPIKQETIKETVTEVPKKKKTVKKIRKYVEESDEEDTEEIEEVIVKKNTKPKQQQQQVKQENQYTDLLYHSSLDRLRERMLNERAKTLVSNVMPCYF